MKTKDILNRETEDLNRKIAYGNLYHERFDSVLLALQRAEIEPTLVAVGSSDFTLYITGDRRVLNKVFGIFRRRGLMPCSRPEEKATNYFTYFDEKYNPEADEDCSPFRIWLNFSSSQCRRVQVGTETKEVPIFEVICDEGETA